MDEPRRAFILSVFLSPPLGWALLSSLMCTDKSDHKPRSCIPSRAQANIQFLLEHISLRKAYYMCVYLQVKGVKLPVNIFIYGGSSFEINKTF